MYSLFGSITYFIYSKENINDGDVLNKLCYSESDCDSLDWMICSLFDLVYTFLLCGITGGCSADHWTLVKSH